MILILSDDNDLSTDNVIDWLDYYGYEWFRINGSSSILLENISISMNGVECNFKNITSGKSISLNSIKSYWYRRGYLNLSFGKKFHFDLKSTSNEAFNALRRYIANERNKVFSFIQQSLEANSGIGRFENNMKNKLMNLKIAAECGFNIPKSFITCSKKYLEVELINKNDGIISKPMDKGFFLTNKSWYNGLTVLLKNEEVNKMDNYFWPTFFQERIDKKFEIRTFFLCDKMFSTAIFSQNDEQTKVDFRNYNILKPNRTPPFKLPNRIEKRIKLFMKKIELNCGSIDIIYSKQNEFVFLEVNPIGQYQQVSGPGNFNLDKKIAEQLILIHEKNTNKCK